MSTVWILILVIENYRSNTPTVTCTKDLYLDRLCELQAPFEPQSTHGSTTGQLIVLLKSIFSGGSTSSTRRIMVETAEKLLSELRLTVLSLENDVHELASLPSDSNVYQQKVKTTAELITRALVNVDSLHISKDAAAQALRDGDREKSRKIAVLLARRKNIVKKLNQIGDEVDALNMKTND